MKESEANRFTSMDGDDGGTSIRVSDEVMTALGTKDLEAGPPEDREDLFACGPWKPCHATVTR